MRAVVPTGVEGFSKQEILALARCGVAFEMENVYINEYIKNEYKYICELIEEYKRNLTCKSKTTTISKI